MPFLLIFIFLALAFVIYYMRPLTDEESNQLSTKRRYKQIRAYYSFHVGEVSVDLQFKKRMKPDGSIYPADESLYTFPATAAGLLKYKKHEWIIVAFEKEKKVDLLWLNKGLDGTGVNLYISIEKIAETAKEKEYTTVLLFHNHPNPDPKRYSCRMASSQDIKTAGEYAQVMNREGANLVEFVCERGRHYEYWLATADSFFPVGEFLAVVNREKVGRHSLKNFSLHMERIFG